MLAMMPTWPGVVKLANTVGAMFFSSKGHSLSLALVLLAAGAKVLV